MIYFLNPASEVAVMKLGCVGLICALPVGLAAQPSVPARLPQPVGPPNLRVMSAAEILRRYPSALAPGAQARLARPVANWRVDPGLLKRLPTAAAANIAADIKQRMAGKAVGFSVTVIMPGGATATANGGMARRAPDGAPRAWTADDRISIASVSKTITAAALMRITAAKGVSLETKAFTLLPPDWTYSDSFRTISPRQLLSHDSGICACNIDYDSLRACAASTLNDSDKDPGLPIWTKYSNANYALMRSIIGRVSDGKSPSKQIEGPRYWAVVNAAVFNPIGTGADCSDLSIVNPALSYLSIKDDMVWNSTAASNYDFTAVKPGNDWGDMTSVCGSQEWTLSSRVLATFARALLVTASLLPQATVDTMRTQQLGLMYSSFGGGLTAYGHGGYHPGPNNGGELRTQILTFNNGVSVGAVVNSRYNGDIAEAVRANAK